MKLYHDLAEYYFSIENHNRDIASDISMISGLASDITNPRLLDIGCGTGEHIQQLSRFGIQCTGVDASEDMLRIARLRYPDSGKFIKNDMLAIDFYQDFDIVISLFGTINYLINDADIDKFMWNIWRALKPGGRGVFEVWNSYPIKKISGKEMGLVSTTKSKDVRIDRHRGFKMINDHGRTVADVRYIYTVSRNGRTQEINDHHVMRAFSKTEIDRFITSNGLAITAHFSSSKMDPYRETSNRIVIHFLRP